MRMISSILDGLRKNSLQATNPQQPAQGSWMQGNSLKPGILSLSDENAEEEEEEPVGDGYVFLKKTGVLRRKSAPEPKISTTITTYLKKQSLPVNPSHISLAHSPEPERKTREKSLTANSPSAATPRAIKRRKRVIRSKSELPPISRKSSLRELLSRASRKMSREDGKQMNSDDEHECTEERVLSWRTSLENILTDPLGLKCFHEFLKREFSEENLLFWQSCERFKEIDDVNEMSRAAKDMFSSYLSRDAPFMVNVDSAGWKKTESELNSPHVGMFDVAQQQVFTLMKFDGYARFLKSPVYLEKLEEGKRNSSAGKGGGGGGKNGKMKWMGHNRQRIKSDSDLATTKDILKRKKSLDSSLVEAEVEDRDKSIDLNGLLPFDNLIKQDISSSIRIVRKGKYSSEKLRARRKKSIGCDNESFRNPDPESGNNNGTVRVILPNGSSASLCSTKHKTIRQGLELLGREMNFWLQDYNVTTSKKNDLATKQNDVAIEKRTDVTLDSEVSSLHGKVVYLENKIPSLRIDLPNGRTVDINTHIDQTLGDAIDPVMKAIGFEPDTYSVLEVKDRTSYKAVEMSTQKTYDVTEIKRRVPVCLESSAATFRNKRLVAEINDKDTSTEKMKMKKQLETLDGNASLPEAQSLILQKSPIPNKSYIKPPKIIIRADSQSSTVEEMKSGIISPVDIMFYSGPASPYPRTGSPGDCPGDCSHSLPCQKCCLKRLDDITAKLRNVPLQSPSQPLSPSFHSPRHGTLDSDMDFPSSPFHVPDADDVVTLRNKTGPRSRPVPVMDLDESQVSNIFYREQAKYGQSDDEIISTSEHLTTGTYHDGRRGVRDYRREDSGIDTTPSNSDDNLNRDDNDVDDKTSNQSSSENSTPSTIKKTLSTTNTTMITTTKMTTFEETASRPTRTLTRGHTIDVVGNRVSSRSVHFFRQFSLCDGVLINSVSMENAFFVPNVVPLKGTRGIVQYEEKVNHVREGIGTENVTFV